MSAMTEKTTTEYTDQKVHLGQEGWSHNGDEIDDRRTIRFRGREVGEECRGDDRGQDITLYEVRGGYRVLLHNWSRWQGELNHTYLACVHGDTCDHASPFENWPPAPSGGVCPESILTAAQVSDRWPGLARRAGIEVLVDLDAGRAESEAEEATS